MINIEQFFLTIRMQLLRLNPFYGSVLTHLPTHYDRHTSTFAVGKNNKNEPTIKLFVNPDYVEHLFKLANDDDLKVINHCKEVLRHEVHHLIFAHLTLDFPDRKRQDIAAELSANSFVNRDLLLCEEGSKKAGVFAEDFGLASRLGVHEYYNELEHNRKYKSIYGGVGGHKTEEERELEAIAAKQDEASKETASGKKGNGEQMKQQEILSNRTERVKDKMFPPTSEEDEDDMFSAPSGSSSTPEPLDETLKKVKKKIEEARELQDEAMDDLSKGRMEEASEEQHEAAKRLREAAKLLEDERASSGGGGGDGEDNMLDSHDKWNAVAGDELTNAMVKDIIRKAHEDCSRVNNWGDLPGEIKEVIQEALVVEKEIIPWEVVLKNFIASSSENVLGYTMKRKSKRYDTRPGTKKDDILSVAIGIDTSGSIDNEMLKIFFRELHWIDKTGTKMTVFEWDTQVNREYDFHDFDGTVSGRGGTDPTDFLEKVSERKFDCVIIFTDMGFADIEKQYNIPMMWVCDRGGYDFDEDYNFPVKEGIIMKVNAERDGFELVKY